MVDVSVEHGSRSIGEADRTLLDATQGASLSAVVEGLERVPSEIWRVQLASGEFRAMTLDELDEAFQAGKIGGETRIMQPGTAHWVKLGQVAGLDEPSPNSLLPVATEIADLDDSPASLRPRKRGVFLVLAACAALVAAVAVVAATRTGVPSAAAAGAPIVAASPPPPPPAATAEVLVKPAQLSDPQKRALLEADKAREAREQKRKPKAATPPRRHAKPGGTPFHEGGNKHDPLNGSL